MTRQVLMVITNLGLDLIKYFSKKLNSKTIQLLGLFSVQLLQRDKNNFILNGFIRVSL